MSKYAASVIGRQLREARKARSLSVAAAARVLKVSREMVYKYEDGSSLPSLDVLTRAANAWDATFWLAGCQVLPKEAVRKKLPTPQPVQQALPFDTTRRYRRASVEIRPRDHEIVITAILRAGH
jgi:transcriptional regulator with XRE-family HTH domain